MFSVLKIRVGKLEAAQVRLAAKLLSATGGAEMGRLRGLHRITKVEKVAIV